eukprot:1718595-Rhodomonas_salina.1
MRRGGAGLGHRCRPPDARGYGVEVERRVEEEMRGLKQHGAQLAVRLFQLFWPNDHIRRIPVNVGESGPHHRAASVGPCTQVVVARGLGV